LSFLSFLKILHLKANFLLGKLNQSSSAAAQEQQKYG
jgi:hypothetical protein